MSRPMFDGLRPPAPIRAPLGTKRSCKTWDAEAALRMLMNNLDDRVAIDWKNLVVYGGSGRAARNWNEYHRIVRALRELAPDETLCVQSGKPVYIAKSRREAPRVIIANSNLVPAWATPEEFDRLDRLGLTMYGQMTAGSWIYIGTQGILQGTYETFAAIARQAFRTESLSGKWILTAGMGGMSGAQPLAATMNEAVILDVEVRPERIERKVKEGFCDRMTAHLDEALAWVDDACRAGEPLSIGLVGNAGTVYPELVRRGKIPDIVTDQTSAHDLLSYVPIGDLAALDRLRERDPKAYRKKSLDTIARHAGAILEMQAAGAVAVDYGNNLRAQASLAGVAIKNQDGSFKYPGFVPAYIRPLFCEGKGPFRWAALSGDPKDIHRIDRALKQTFPKEKALKRWIDLAQKKIPFTGLPARICWLGYGDRAKFGDVINRMVKKGEVSAPIVIGRDHLDCGSVASPHRETEGLADGSDAIADWPLLNFALNAVNGASWVSFHHGGGVGIGNALHAGMVIVADGTKARAGRLERVLTVDPGIGVARHVDAGYEKAKETAKKKRLKVPEECDSRSSLRSKWEEKVPAVKMTEAGDSETTTWDKYDEKGKTKILESRRTERSTSRLATEAQHAREGRGRTSEGPAGAGGSIDVVREPAGGYRPPEGTPEERPDPIESTRNFETAQGRLSYSDLSERLAIALIQILEEILQSSPDQIVITSEWLCLRHKTLAGDLFPVWAGRYRDVNVQVGTHMPPPFFEVPILMRLFCDDLAERLRHIQPRDHGIEAAAELLAWTDWRFQWIHPFKDFNGRIGRVLLAALLYKLALPHVVTAPSEADTRNRYLQALHAADEGDLRALTDIWVSRIAEAL